MARNQWKLAHIWNAMSIRTFGFLFTNRPDYIVVTTGVDKSMQKNFIERVANVHRKKSNKCSQVPQLYCIQLGVQYPKNSKIWLWLLPQPTLGNALVEVDKNWNISGLLSRFQLEKLFFIHTVRSYSHSTATAEFVTSIGLKKWDGFLTFSTEFPKKKPNIAQEKSESAEMWEMQLIWAFWWKYKSGGGRLQIRRWQ